ncbi:unnamed protein product [Eretmochelys imbricata]
MCFSRGKAEVQKSGGDRVLGFFGPKVCLLCSHLAPAEGFPPFRTGQVLQCRLHGRGNCSSLAEELCPPPRLGSEVRGSSRRSWLAVCVCVQSSLAALFPGALLPDPSGSPFALHGSALSLLCSRSLSPLSLSLALPDRGSALILSLCVSRFHSPASRGTLRVEGFALPTPISTFQPFS